MTHECATIRRPEHPVYALTTYELAGYRRELEEALTALPEHAPASGQVRRLLAEVRAEQADRAEIARRPVSR